MLLCTFETNPSNTDGQGDQTSAFCNIRCSYSQRAGCCVSHAFTSTCWGFNKCAVEASTPSFIFFYFCAERTSCAASVELVCFSRNPNACLRRATLRHAAGCEYGQGVFLAATMPRHRESDRERDTRTQTQQRKGVVFSGVCGAHARSWQGKPFRHTARLCHKNRPPHCRGYSRRTSRSIKGCPPLWLSSSARSSLSPALDGRL